MADGRKNNGGHSTKGRAGRKPKADEQALVEKLSPLSPIAFKALKTAIQDNQSWAVKMFMEYTYGKPKETIDLNNNLIRKPEPKYFRDFTKNE